MEIWLNEVWDRKKEYDDILCEWQTSFLTNPNKGQLFMELEDTKLKTIKPTYTKGGSWLPFIGFYNFLYTWATYLITGHAPIGEYRQQFFPNLSSSCPCGQAEVQT